MKTIVYWLVRLLCRIGLPFYFSHFEVVGKQKVPAKGPLIFAPNHHNAFLDAILIGVLSPREVHFLTRADVFVPPFLWILNALNMMPVYRRRDGYDKLAANEAIFKKCRDLLGEGKCILIFPEGNQADTHYLRPLTKGTSRLAFQAQESNPLPIKVIPVGLNYFNMFQPKRKLIVCFGDPISVKDHTELYASHPARGLIQLRDAIAEGIKQCLVIPRKDDLYEERKKIFTPANEKFSFPELRQRAAEIDFKVTQYHPKWKIWVWILSLANWLPLWIVHLVLKKKVRDPQFIGPLKFVLGLVIFPLWWIFIFFILLWTTSLVNAVFSTVLIAVSLFVRQALKNRVGPYSTIES